MLVRLNGGRAKARVIVYKYTMHQEPLVEIMDSKVEGIALFTEGRSPEVNSAIPATEESIISLVARNSAWCICFISFQRI